MYAELCAQREQAESQLRAECGEQRMQSRRVQQQLQEELAKLQQLCTESLLQAESHKQQVTVLGLQTEFQDLWSRFEESLSSREVSERSLNNQIRELSMQRQEAQHEVTQPKILHSSCSVTEQNLLFRTHTKIKPYGP